MILIEYGVGYQFWQGGISIDTMLPTVLNLRPSPILGGEVLLNPSRISPHRLFTLKPACGFLFGERAVELPDLTKDRFAGLQEAKESSSEKRLE